MEGSPRKDTSQPDTAATTEAFKLLSDETRLELLEALWEGDDPTDSSPMRFADLRERVTVDDPGQIHYHLDKLTAHFVRNSEEGYELRESGKRIVRMLLSGIALEHPEIEPVEIDVSCPYCGGQTLCSYRDGWRYLECTDCDVRCVPSFPPGVISMSEFPPSGVRNRTPNEIGHADWIWAAHRRVSVIDGVCPECAGDMPITSIYICDDHQPDWEEYQFCEHCESIFWILVTHVCKQCEYRWSMPISNYLTREPAVAAFYYDHGVEFDFGTPEQFGLLLDVEKELLSEDPLRIRMTIHLEDEELNLTYDNQLDVISTERYG
ncbi:winged helix-turn-helix domain-containing protein [Natrarchaeobius chitinivorans]|uniref:ArsR family transcriptional regulator n=2 Tax=Natrarchaeobius chitinivorans TaxID=1679083 RepID=A0A3N6LU81_NATCH|nr:ArsR family transcriptional regulator [Natrarchaeobius chitinivorans]